MFEVQPGMSQRELLLDEQAVETPWVKKYVRAIIAEADPQGNIRTHEGVVTRDFGKEIEVVNPQPYWAGLGNPPWPKYVTKQCHKEGATEIPIPIAKAKGIEEIRERLDSRV
jgi:hypothetical protein